MQEHQGGEAVPLRPDGSGDLPWTLFDSFEHPVSVFGTDGTYRYINDAGRDVLGDRAGDVVGGDCTCGATRGCPWPGQKWPGQGEVRVSDRNSRSALLARGTRGAVLTRHDRRHAPVAVLEDLEEVVALCLREGAEAPVVEDEDVDLREACQQARARALGTSERELVEQPRDTAVEDAAAE